MKSVKRRNKRERFKKAVSVLMTAMLLFVGTASSLQVYGAQGSYIKIAQSGGFFAEPGSQGHPISLTVKNGDSKDHTISVALSDVERFVVKTKPIKVTLKAGESTELTFKTDIHKFADQKGYELAVNATEGNDTVGTSNARVTLTGGVGTYSGLGINYALDNPDGMTAGQVNNLRFELYNRGGSVLKNLKASLTLPEGMTIHNAGNSVNVNYLYVGDRTNIMFPLRLDETLSNKNYAISLKITGTDGNGQDKTFDETFYIQVIGGTNGSGTKNLSISNVSLPSQTATGKDFSLSFTVKNNGTTSAKNLKIAADIPEGLLNKTTATFVENSIAAGATKSYSITLFAPDTGKDVTYPIKISAQSLDDEKAQVMQYASVYVKPIAGSSTTKTPRLMVDNYSYGGTFVKAGNDFTLNLGLFNTSKKTLSNIKVTLTAADGTVVPVDSSNAFFVESVEPKGHYTKSLTFSVKPTAEQKTTAITVSMAYEDGSGEALTSEDTVSIPVVQDSRLVVDDPSAPYECFVGSECNSEIQFYNMGKTTLNNVRVKAEGNFDTVQSTSYYVGNMASGNSDSYSFTFIPKEVGPVEGTITFSYEDVAGEQQVIAVPFLYQAMEMPPMDPGMDPGMMEPEQKMVPWKKIGIGAGIAVVAIGAIVYAKRRKKKMQAQLDMEDE